MSTDDANTNIKTDRNSQIHCLERIASIFLEQYNPSDNFNQLNFPSRMSHLALVVKHLAQNPELDKEVRSLFLSVNNTVRSFERDKKSTLSLDESRIYMFDNSGSGGTIQLFVCAASTILSAIDMCVLEKGHFDKQTILANLPRAFDNFRSFYRGESVAEEHLIGLSGLSLPENCSINFGEMKAFSLNDFQSNYFFGYDSNINVAIRSNFRRKLLFSDSPDKFSSFISKNNVAISEYRSRLIKNLQSARLALILALSKKGQLCRPYVAMDYTITSSGNLNSFIWHDENNHSQKSPFRIESNMLNKISIKFLEITDSDLSSISVAVSRLLSAICDRSNIDDALIDAVMCWENIIGAQSEVSFRVCAAMAKLLSSHSNNTNELFAELKKIYKARCELVHGDTNYRTNEEIVNQAIFFAIGLINSLLDRPDLLSQKSSERSKSILLQ